MSQAGGTWRDRRILQEILLIAPQFSEVIYDDELYRWVILPDYPLPAKWAERQAALLIVLPEGYPVTPPIGFYLNRKFRLKDGRRDPHLLSFSAHGAPDLAASGWKWYCVQVLEAERGGWQASADFRKRDNLQSLLTLVEEVLTND